MRQIKCFAKPIIVAPARDHIMANAAPLQVCFASLESMVSRLTCLTGVSCAAVRGCTWATRRAIPPPTSYHATSGTVASTSCTPSVRAQRSLGSAEKLEPASLHALACSVPRRPCAPSHRAVVSFSGRISSRKLCWMRCLGCPDGFGMMSQDDICGGDAGDAHTAARESCVASGLLPLQVSMPLDCRQSSSRSRRERTRLRRPRATAAASGSSCAASAFHMTGTARSQRRTRSTTSASAVIALFVLTEALLVDKILRDGNQFSKGRL